MVVVLTFRLYYFIFNFRNMAALQTKQHSKGTVHIYLQAYLSDPM